MMRTVLFAALLLGLTACDSGKKPLTVQGYVEGEYLRLAPREPGTLAQLKVTEGGVVAQGAVLYSLDDERARLQLAKSIASLKEAEARVSDMSRGGRTEEIQAADQRLEQARADLTIARSTYERTQNLVKDGFASRQRLDEHKASFETAKAILQEAQYRAEIVRLPSRSDAIVAAQAGAAAANAAVDLARQDLADREVKAPEAGSVEAIYFRPGEFVPAGQPVLALLPPANVKVRFFVPEPQLARIQLGGTVDIDCDNCSDDLQGTIVFVAAEAEFTPPVIYSREERAKLVFMVEARPLGAASLRPGQPVDVRIPR